MWGRLFTAFLLIAVVAGLTGAALGPVAGLGTAVACLVIWILRSHCHLAALAAWLRAPAPENVPIASGPWEDVFADLYRLLRRQKESESRLAETLVDFRRAAAAMPDGVVIIDAQDRIEWCNPRAESHLGLDRGRDVGQSIAYMVRNPGFAERLAAGESSEPVILRRPGDDRAISVLVVPYGESRKLVLSRDITERERVETIRRDFVANVSHELRTPITVLSGFLETLADSGDPSPSLLRRSLPLMSDQSRRMQRLVEDLLTLSRLEGSDNPVREDPVDMRRMASELHGEALALSGGKHNIVLDVSCDARVLGAEEEIRSACGNLVSNAVRYTPASGEVRIEWVSSGDGAAFRVRDTGIGIAASHLPRLTERFYRVDRSRSRETGGTGLGLAIVKHVANRHQARLEIRSRPGEGSEFSLRFPAERLRTHAPEVAAAEA